MTRHTLTRILVLGLFTLLSPAVGAGTPQGGSPPSAAASRDPAGSTNGTVARQSDRRVGVAVMAPLSTSKPETVEIDKVLRAYLGQVGGIQYILEPRNATELFDMLAGFTRDGKQIDYLIIAGHGTCGLPHIALAKDLDPKHVDIDSGRELIRSNLYDLLTLKRRSCAASLADKIDEDTRNLIDDLEGQITDNQNSIRAAKEHLAAIEKVQDVMAENARILLINCSAACDIEGRQFVRSIGRVLLSKRGGSIQASKRDIDMGQAGSGDSLARGLWEWVNSYIKRGGASWGEIYLSGKYFDWGNWVTMEIPKQETPAPIDPYLLVDTAPRCGRVDEGTGVPLKASVEALPDSGSVEHSWLGGCAPRDAAACVADTTFKAGGIAEYEISVKDERGRTGRDVVSLRVDAPDYGLAIQLDEASPAVGSTVLATPALTGKSQPPKDSYGHWSTEGDLELAGKPDTTARVKVKGAGVIKLQLLTIGLFGKTHVLAEASLAVAAKAAPTATEGTAKAPAGDLKSQAEAKHQWLKDSLAYLESLKEYDRKTYATFKAGVTSAMVRDFVGSNPRSYDDKAALPEDCSAITSDVLLQSDCQAAKNAGCGQTVGEARERMSQYGADCSATIARGCKVVRTVLTTRTVDGKDVKVEEPVTDCDDVCAKAHACGRAFTTYSGRDGYASDVQAHVNDNSLRCLGEAGAANGRYQKDLSRKLAELPETPPLKRWQEYKAFGDWSGYLAAVEKVKQEYGLPEPIPSPPVLPWTYTSPCGGASVAGPAQGPGELRVTLGVASSGLTGLKPGDAATVDAGVSGGRPPYRYAWSGASGNGAKATARPTWAGDWTVRVTVTDADGKTGEALATLQVQPLALKLTGAQGQVYYGSTHTIGAEGLEAVSAPTPQAVADPCAGRTGRSNNPYDECNTIVVDKSVSVVGTAVPPSLAYEIPATSTAGNAGTAAAAASTGAGGKYRYVWQAEPAVTFNPPTTDRPATQVTYDRMGQVKLWCEVHTLVEGAWHTVGECEKVSVEVVAPEFTFTFTPPNGEGRIGQEVRAVLGTRPPVAAKLIDYRWLEPASSNRSEYTENASEIGFKVKDPKPIALQVLARVPHHGDAIAELSATYAGIAYDVQIGAPRLRGPQLQVWVCDTQLGRGQQCGMRDIPPGQFVTFQDIDLPAIVTPKPESPRYRWSVSPSGSCGLPGSGSELHLNCSDTGSYVVALEVADADGNVLGKAETSVSISVRMEQTKPGATPDPALDGKKAQEARIRQLAETAAAQIRAGQLDGARATIAALRPLDPPQADRLARELAVATTKGSGASAPKRDVMNRAEQAMLNGRCDEARTLMGEIAARTPTAQERKWLDMMSSELSTRTKRKRCVGAPRAPAGTAIPGVATAPHTPPSLASPGTVGGTRPPVTAASPSGRARDAPATGGGNWTGGAPGARPGGGQGQVPSRPVAPTATGAAGSIRIEACVDGSDWLRIENGRLVHEHRGFAQIGTHPDCPASHAVPGGGLLVDGRPVPLAQLPFAVGIGSLDRFEVEQARGAVRLDGEKGLLLDDDGPGGPAVYVVRLHGRAASAGASAAAPQAAPKGLQTGKGGASTNGPTVLTGRWRTRCESDSDVYPVTIQQDGSRISVVVERQGRYQGTFDGRRLSGASSDGLDRFTGEVVSANELRLDWEGRLSAGGQPFRNRCRLSRD